MERSGASLMMRDFIGGKGHEPDLAAKAGTVLGAGDTHHGYAYQWRLGPDQHRANALFLVVLNVAQAFRPEGFRNAGNHLARQETLTPKGVSYKLSVISK